MPILYSCMFIDKNKVTYYQTKMGLIKGIYGTRRTDSGLTGVLVDVTFSIVVY